MSDKHLKFYLNKDDDTKNNSNIYDYVITLNKELVDKTEKLTIENQKTKHKLNISEEEIDKLETSVRYMKGEMKNLIYIKEELVKNSSLFNRKNNLTIKADEIRVNIIKKLMIFIFISNFFNLSMLSLLFYFDNLSLIPVYTSTFILHSTIAYFLKLFPTQYIVNFSQRLDLIDLENKSIENLINQKNKEIEKIEEANDFLTKYIDNL